MDPFLRLVYEMHGHFRYWDLGSVSSIQKQIKEYARMNGLDPNNLLETLNQFRLVHPKIYNPYFHDSTRDWSKEAEYLVVLKDLLDPDPLNAFYTFQKTSYRPSKLYRLLPSLQQTFVDLTAHDFARWETILTSPRIQSWSEQFNLYLHDPNRAFEHDPIFVIRAKALTEGTEIQAFSYLQEWNPSFEATQFLLRRCQKLFLDFSEQDQRLWQYRVKHYFRLYHGQTEDSSLHQIGCKGAPFSCQSQKKGDGGMDADSISEMDQPIWTFVNRLVQKKGQMTRNDYDAMITLPLKLFYARYRKRFAAYYSKQENALIEQFVRNHIQMVTVDEIEEPREIWAEKLKFELQFRPFLFQLIQTILKEPTCSLVPFFENLSSTLDVSMKDYFYLFQNHLSFYFQEWFSSAFSELACNQIKSVLSTYQLTSYQKKKA